MRKQIRNPAKSKVDQEKENKYLRLISGFDIFIKDAGIVTLQNIPLLKFSDILNDAENINIDFIKGPHNEIYVIFKSNYIQDRRISNQVPTNLLICAISGVYCYVPILVDVDSHELKIYERKYFINFPYNETRTQRKDHWVTIDIVTFNKHKIDGTIVSSNFYIFDDPNYAVMISFIKDNFISNFFYLIEKFKLKIPKIEFDNLHSLIYNKFKTFDRFASDNQRIKWSG